MEFDPQVWGSNDKVWEKSGVQISAGYRSQDRVGEGRSESSCNRRKKTHRGKMTNYLKGTLHNWVFVLTAFKASEPCSFFLPGPSEGAELA